MIIANRMAVESQAQQYPFIDASEAQEFKRCKFPAYYWWVVLHELLGHGTGRMMVETEEGKYNFDINNPPINPITGQPISSWYKPGQTWTGQFEELATTVDECRAELVGAYLMDDVELLELFGFTKASDVTAAACRLTFLQDDMQQSSDINTSDVQSVSATWSGWIARAFQFQR